MPSKTSIQIIHGWIKTNICQNLGAKSIFTWNQEVSAKKFEWVVTHS